MSRVYKSTARPTEVKVLPVGGPVSNHFVRASEGQEKESGSAQEHARLHAEKILSDAEEMARHLMEQAKQEITQMRAEASREIEQWWTEKQQEWHTAREEAQAQGYEDGFAQGREAGMLAAEQEYQETIQSARQILEQAYEEKERIISSAEPFLLTLSTEIAKKVIQQELKADPEIIMGTIESLMLRAKERSSMVIAVHPEDYPFVLNRRQQLAAMVDSQAELKIIPDSSVGPGGCLLRTSQGSLDARLDHQLEEIKSALLSLAKDEAHA